MSQGSSLPWRPGFSSHLYPRARTLSLQILTKLVRLTITQTESFPFDVVLLAAQKALRDEEWLGILDEMGDGNNALRGLLS